MKENRPDVSIRAICRILRVSRSSMTMSKRSISQPAEMPLGIAKAIKEIIQQHPTFGYRRIWSILRFKMGFEVNRKRVYRIIRKNGWFCHQRRNASRPRVQGRTSIAKHPNTRWAMDVTHFPCGRDGLGHLVAVIDCFNREIIGYELSTRSRANEAERALETACINRFGTIRPMGPTPTVRSDNGLIFQSRRFREACRFYRLSQEFITPYTPEQNGVIERFFRSFKEECAWQHNFTSIDEARGRISAWIDWYNHERPHQSLGYRAPAQFEQLKLVA